MQHGGLLSLGLLPRRLPSFDCAGNHYTRRNFCCFVWRFIALTCLQQRSKGTCTKRREGYLLCR